MRAQTAMQNPRRCFGRVAAPALFYLFALSREAVAVAGDLADEADVQFNIGADRYEAHDYVGALEHFLASNRLVPNKNVVFNIARTYEQLRKASEAYRYYTLALANENDTATRARIGEAFARITPKIAILQIETSPPGATIYLDRKDLGSRGITPTTIGLGAGKRRIIIEASGYEPIEVLEVEAVVGQQRKLEFKLNRIVGTLRIEGQPGAHASLADEAGPITCILPCTITAPIGRHTLTVAHSGFATSELPVEVLTKQQVTVKVELLAETGAAVIHADIRDALIEIDGYPFGFTPAVLNLPVGVHRLRVSHAGFRPVEQELTIQKVGQKKIEVQLSLLEEVNAASRATESVEDAPASVSIVSRDELRAMAYPTIAEAVRGVRGLYLSDDRTYQTIGFRGYSAPGNYGNRVLVLLDGHPMNDNYIWSSNVGFDARVDLEDVERIEIVRGAGSVLYGSSAFLGVINLVTRQRSQASFTELGISTVEYGVGRARATRYQKIGQRAGLWASISGAYGTGRDLFIPELAADPTNPNAARDASGAIADGNARDVDMLRAATLSGRAWYKDFTAQWFLTARNKPLRAGEFGTTLNDSRTRLRETRGLIEARYEPHVSETLELLTRAHLNLVDFAGAYALSDAREPIRELYRSLWAGLEQRAVVKPSDRVRITVGGEFVRHFQVRLRGSNGQGAYSLASTGNTELHVPFSSLAAYANGDLILSKALKLVAGVRFDYFSNVETFDLLPSLNPRFAAVWKPYTSGNLKFVVGKAFKTPAVYERYYTSTTQAPSVGLQPEQVFSGEVEYAHRFSQATVGTVSVYGNYISRVIELGKTGLNPDANPDAVAPDIYRNARTDVFVAGAEAELRREWRQGFMASASYSFQRARYVNATNLRRVPNSPEHLASIKAAAPLVGGALTIATRLSLEGIRHDNAVAARTESGLEAAPQGTTEPGFIWDIVLSGTAEKLGLRYNLGLYNAANTKYDTVPSTESPQRTIVQNGRTVLAALGATF
jgi:outer membrane receptor protein involved in Fe transport